MSVGGATWDTAGTLDLGSGNTFDTADATEDAAFLNNQGWWTFTVAAGSVVGLSLSDISLTTLRLYRGATFAGREFVDERDFVSPTTTYLLSADTYHLVVGTDGVGVPTTYQVTYTQTPLTVGPWISTLQEQDNVLIVSEGTILEENPPEFQIAKPWFDLVIDRVNPPGRLGHYGTREDFLGPPIDGAASCLWSHALLGVQDSITSWEGVCPVLETGVAELVSNADTYYELDSLATLNPFADEGVANIRMFSVALFVLPLRDNLDPRGVLAHPSPEDDGYPPEAEIEWEEPFVGLEMIEITAAGNPFDEGEVVNGVNAALRDKVQPHVSGTWQPWVLGVPGQWNEGDRAYVQFAYKDGPVEWTDIPDLLPGDGGWDGLAEYDPAGVAIKAPDEVVIVGIDQAWGLGSVVNPSEEFASAEIALRFHLRAPRYRWVYEGPTTVVRQWPRDDTRGVSSAPRLWPPPKTSRIAGGYPGGSGM